MASFRRKTATTPSFIIEASSSQDLNNAMEFGRIIHNDFPSTIWDVNNPAHIIIPSNGVFFMTGAVFLNGVNSGKNTVTFFRITSNGITYNKGTNRIRTDGISHYGLNTHTTELLRKNDDLELAYFIGEENLRTYYSEDLGDEDPRTYLSLIKLS